ncbi:MAG: lipid kinase [Candidatus Eremiobacteraeota bacterium]|nr:lipid kinase [Candidatus Eremiobacteraeota bacterium]MBC5827904.1 lipid kinase [Candidatus Eremiobacteraeota bacterium]
MSVPTLFFVNRTSRRGAQTADAAGRKLFELGFSLIECPMSDPRSLRDTIRNRRQDVRLAIIGGGDGTLNGAADALVETNLPLGILPLGTANDLAQTLGIPKRIPDACEVIARGKTRRIDVGTVNGKHFLNEAGLGLSAKLARRLTKKGKGVFGTLAVGWSALQIMVRARPFRAEVRCGDQVLALRSIHIMVANGSNFGGWIVNRDAAIDDQVLDLYSLEVEHWRQTFSILPSMLTGRYESCPGLRLLHGREFEIKTARPHSIDTDGEITTQCPAVFRLLPQALSVFVPET